MASLGSSICKGEPGALRWTALATVRSLRAVSIHIQRTPFDDRTHKPTSLVVLHWPEGPLEGRAEASRKALFKTLRCMLPVSRK